MNLVYRNEHTLFAIAATISAIFWLILVIATLGIALLYVLFGFLIYLFAQSGFISHIKGNGVKVTDAQYPDLHRSVIDCCKKVGLDTPPEMYLLRTDFFNALATKFLGRNFIVLFTDVVDALADEPNAIDFYVGHELGHVHRKHLKWMAFLFPALLLPVLGTAYRRAQEYTCDRYGALCCETEDQVHAALAAISAGNTRWKELNPSEYFEQIPVTSEFWMSFHELTNDYPWLTKRMASALAFHRKEEIRHPRRSFFAGLLSIFVPRFGTGGRLSVLVTIAMIGILAAIAIPAYQDYTIRAQISEGLNLARTAQAAVTNRIQATGELAANNEIAGLPPAERLTGKYVFSVAVDAGTVVITYGNGANVMIDGQTIVLTPEMQPSNPVQWTCSSQSIQPKHLPAACR